MVNNNSNNEDEDDASFSLCFIFFFGGKFKRRAGAPRALFHTYTKYMCCGNTPASNLPTRISVGCTLHLLYCSHLQCISMKKHQRRS